MKNTIIVLIILFTISLAGGLYSAFSHSDNAKMIHHNDVRQFPQEMSTLNLHPMPVVPLY